MLIDPLRHIFICTGGKAGTIANLDLHIGFPWAAAASAAAAAAAANLPATATAAQLITAATITAYVRRHRHRENDTATAAIAEPLVIKRGCCDNLCGNYVVIVFAKVSLGFLVVIRVVVCCCFNLLKCSDGRVNLFRPCRSLCRHCCRYTLFVEDLNLMLDSGEKRYL
jgi:hypothetical protein